MFSLSALLLLYFVFLAIFVIFILIHIYHIVVSAALTPVSFLVTFFVIAAGSLTIYGAWTLLQNVNFQQPLFNTKAFTNDTSPAENFKF